MKLPVENLIKDAVRLLQHHISTVVVIQDIRTKIFKKDFHSDLLSYDIG